MAFSADNESFEAPQSVMTPNTYDEGLKLFLEMAQRCAVGRTIDKVCGGIAGPFKERERSLIGSPNLTDWIGKPLKNDLEKNLQAPIYIENDAALVGLGEAIVGAGKDKRIIAYITVSTGVGGARIVNGKIDEKAVGFEPGHQILDIASGKTLQDLVSGKSLEIATGKHPKEIEDREVWQKLAVELAVGIHNTLVHWSPDCLVLGGSMIVGNPCIPLDAVESHLKSTLKIYPEIPPIKKAELGDFGGLHGALAYLKNQ